MPVTFGFFDSDETLLKSANLNFGLSEMDMLNSKITVLSAFQLQTLAKMTAYCNFTVIISSNYFQAKRNVA